MFLDEIKIKKSSMSEYEYNTAMADACCLEAVTSYHEGDAVLTTFFKNAEIGFRQRALDGELWVRDQITKSLKNCNRGILKHGHRTSTGTCIY